MSSRNHSKKRTNEKTPEENGNKTPFRTRSHVNSSNLSGAPIPKYDRDSCEWNYNRNAPHSNKRVNRRNHPPRANEYHPRGNGNNTSYGNRRHSNGSDSSRLPIPTHERDARNWSNNKHTPYANNRGGRKNYLRRGYRAEVNRRSNQDSYVTHPSLSDRMKSSRGGGTPQHGTAKDGITKQRDRNQSITYRTSAKKNVNHHDDRNLEQNPRFKPPTARPSSPRTLYQASPDKSGSKRFRESGKLEAHGMAESATKKARISSSRGNDDFASAIKRTSRSRLAKPVPVKDLVKEEKRHRRKPSICPVKPSVLDEKLSAMMWLWDEKWKWETNTSEAKPFPARSKLCEAFRCSNSPSHNSHEPAFENQEKRPKQTLDDEEWMIQASELLINDIDKEVEELDKLLDGN